MLIGDIIDVFRKGRSVANPELWKNVGATGSAVAGVATSALAVAAAFGYRIDLDDAAVQALAMGVAGVLYLVGGGLHIITSDKVGLPPKSDDTGDTDTYANSVGADPEAVKRFLATRFGDGKDSM